MPPVITTSIEYIGGPLCGRSCTVELIDGALPGRIPGSNGGGYHRIPGVTTKSGRARYDWRQQPKAPAS